MQTLARFTLLFIPLLLQPVFAEQVCETDYPQSTPSSQFEVHGDGTVTDKKTNLIWKRCVQGVSGANCDVGSAKRMTWEKALQEAENTSGWRLPNLKELRSIVEEQCVRPALNTHIFPISSTAFLVWSSSPYAYTAYGAWSVDFDDGGATNHHLGRDSELQVRLVRSGQ